MRRNERRGECVVRVDLGGKGRLRGVLALCKRYTVHFKVQREK